VNTSELEIAQAGITTFQSIRGPPIEGSHSIEQIGSISNIISGNPGGRPKKAAGHFTRDFEGGSIAACAMDWILASFTESAPFSGFYCCTHVTEFICLL
jgi:hypothetical protein